MNNDPLLFVHTDLIQNKTSWNNDDICRPSKLQKTPVQLSTVGNIKACGNGNATGGRICIENRR